MKDESVKKEDNEQKTLLKVVPDNFPIESYLDGEGNVVVCIKEKDYQAQVLGQLYEKGEKIDEIHTVLKT